MSYIVQWHDDAANELAAHWFNRPSMQKAITDAAVELTRRLQLHGPSEGESRSHGRRITFVRPVGIIFHVQDNFVEVLRLWIFD